MCIGRARPWLDIDYPVDFQGHSSIHEILVVPAVNHKYMLAEVVRTLVAGQEDIQAADAVALADESAAVGQYRQNLCETVWVIAAAAWSTHRRSIVHKYFAE